MLYLPTLKKSTNFEIEGLATGPCAEFRKGDFEWTIFSLIYCGYYRPTFKDFNRAEG